MQQHAPRGGRPRQRTAARRRSSTASTDARPSDFGRKCLLARRLVERGVRFVQIYSGGAHNDDNWDAHGDLVKNHTLPRRRHRQADRRPAQGPEAARAARRDAGRLGRRVRPPADRRVRRGHRPRPQRLRLHHVDGRRRHQGRRQRRRRPTNSAPRPSRTASTSRTCTPRSCTRWASIPNGLTYFYGGLDQKLVGVEAPSRSSRSSPECAGGARRDGLADVHREAPPVVVHLPIGMLAAIVIVESMTIVQRPEKITATCAGCSSWRQRSPRSSRWSRAGSWATRAGIPTTSFSGTAGSGSDSPRCSSSARSSR